MKTSNYAKLLFPLAGNLLSLVFKSDISNTTKNVILLNRIFVENDDQYNNIKTKGSGFCIQF